MGFCVVNFQSGPDLLPLYPFIGIYAGWFIAELPRLLNSFAAISRRASMSRLVHALPSFALLFCPCRAVSRAALYKLEELTLRYPR